MNMTKKNTNRYICDIENIFVISGSISFLVLFIYAWKGIYPFGQHMIMWGDMTQQGIPWLYNAYDVLTGEMSSDFNWRFSGGLAGSSLLYSIFNFPLLFTSRDNIYQFVSVILLYKMICMGISMYFFARQYSVPRLYHVLAGILYGCGSCVLIHYQIGYVMLDIAILFPIFMIGFYSMMEGKSPIPYILLLVLCMNRSLYVSFMVCVYLLFLSGIYLYYRTSRKEFFTYCRILILSTLLAMGISAVFWMPDLSSILNSNRLTMDTSGHEGFLSIYLRDISVENIYTFVHFALCSCSWMGSTFFIAMICFFWKQMTGELRYHKYQFILILLAVFIPGTEVLWHGGSHQMWPVRFTFIVTFVLLEIFLSLTQHRRMEIVSQKDSTDDRKFFYLACAGLAEIFLFYVIFRFQGLDFWIYLILFTMFLLFPWILFYSFILKHNITYRSIVLVLALLLEISCNSMNWIAPDFSKLSASEKQITPDWNTEKYNQYFIIATKLSQELNPQQYPFYRTRDIHNSFNNNYAAVTKTYSISNFTGALPGHLQHQYSNLGYGLDYVRILDSGGTCFSDALLGVTNVFTVEDKANPVLYEEDPSIQSVHWYRCRYTLPVGIEIQQDAIPDENVFSYQNHIFQSLTGRQDTLIEDYSDSIRNGHINLFIHGKQELYFYKDYNPNNLYGVIDEIYVNGVPFKVPNLTEYDNTAYPVEFNSGMLDLGTFEDENVHLEIVGSDISSIHVGLLDLRKMEEAFEVIWQKNPSGNVQTGKKSVSINRQSEKGGILFLPMNYHEAWSCEVNGKPVNLKSVFGGFMGIPMELGNNEIKMVFDAQKNNQGIVISLMSLIGFAILCFLYRNQLWIRKWKGIDFGCGVSYLIIFAVFLMIFYIVPIPVYVYHLVMK